jgi:hypothetical protein
MELDPIRQAVERMAVATELLNQIWAVQSLEEQKLVGEEIAAQEINRLINEHRKETAEVSKLLDQILQNGKTKSLTV